MQITNLKRSIAGFGYLCFGIVAFLLFFYISFPFHLVQDKIMQTFEAKTGCQTNVNNQNHTFPLVLRWGNIQVVCPMGIPFTVESFETDIAVKPLLFHQTAQIAFRIRMTQKNGEIAGTVHIHSTPEGLAYSLKEKGWGLNLKSIGYSGILNMKGEGKWTGNNLFFGEGSLAFTLNGLQIDLQGLSSHAGRVATIAGMAPLIGVTSMAFSSIQGEMAWEDKVVTVNKFQANSDIADLTTHSGSLIFNEPISQSFLATNLQVDPKGNLKKILPLVIPNYSDKVALTFAITGALISPQVMMNGVPLPAFS